MIENEIRIQETTMWREWITVRGLEPITLKDIDDRLAELQQQVKVEPEVKPACEMERPRLENFYPEGTNIKTIQSAFIENIELYNYINALDLYIDELESKSV